MSSTRPVLIKINDKRSKSEKRRQKNIILKCGPWLKTSEEEEEEEKKRRRDMQRFPPHSRKRRKVECVRAIRYLLRWECWRMRAV